MRNPEARMNRVPGRSAGVECGRASGEIPPDEQGRRPRKVRMWRGQSLEISAGLAGTRHSCPGNWRGVRRPWNRRTSVALADALQWRGVGVHRAAGDGRQGIGSRPCRTGRLRGRARNANSAMTRAVPVRRRARIEHDLHDRYRPPRARNAISKRAVASRCDHGGSRCGRGGLVGDRHGSAVGAVPGYWSSAGSRAAALQRTEANRGEPRRSGRPTHRCAARRAPAPTARPVPVRP